MTLAARTREDSEWAAQGLGSHMKVILALAAVATATTDVFLASDRMAASAAVLNSVCDNSQPTALRLHLLAPTKEAAQTLATATETACDGAVVLPYGLAEFETLVRTRVGEEPMWTTALSKVERSKSTYAVPVAPWDRDEKHTSPCVVCVRNLESLTPSTRRATAGTTTPASTRPN